MSMGILEMCLATEKVYGSCEYAVLGSYNIDVRDCAQKCDINPKCYSFTYFNRTMLTMFESNPVVKRCFLKERICSEEELLYRYPSVHTYYKGLTPTGLIELFPKIYGYEKLKGQACTGSHTSQQQLTAAECAIKCNHDNDCGSFVSVASLVRTDNPITHLCYLKPVSCTFSQASIDTTVEGVYSYFKTSID